MKDLILIKDGKAITTSLIIAEYFEKQHKNVIRDIEALNCSKEFNGLNFELISYVDSMKRVKQCYEITRDGFTMLAMGYTGEKAMRFKEEYIKQFNKMEEALRQGNNAINQIPEEITLQKWSHRLLLQIY